jgi:hypothetical protein
LFVILATSTIGVFIPIIAERFSSIRTDHIVFIGLRQFGTGIIISTALVHVSVHIKEQSCIQINHVQNLAVHSRPNLLQQ